PTSLRSFSVFFRHVVLACSRSLLLFVSLSDLSLSPLFDTLSLHDALPICDREAYLGAVGRVGCGAGPGGPVRDGGACGWRGDRRSEEHTSELQSRFDLVCRLLLEKKKKK